MLYLVVYGFRMNKSSPGQSQMPGDDVVFLTAQNLSPNAVIKLRYTAALFSIATFPR